PCRTETSQRSSAVRSEVRACFGATVKRRCARLPRGDSSTNDCPPRRGAAGSGNRAHSSAQSRRSHLGQGYYHYACLKDYDVALRYFEQVRQFLPNSSRIPEFLAYVTRRQGEWGRSESYFNEAERLDPRNIWLLTNHAFSYSALRRFPEALRKFDQVLNIIPDDVDTLA